MANYENPKGMTNAELAAFARDEHINHSVGFAYTNGIKVVDAVYSEIARRLEESEVVDVRTALEHRD